MKRFAAMLIAIISALLFAACAATPVNSPLKGQKPWDWGSNSIYERSEYKVSRLDNKDNVLGEGSMVFILESANDITSENTEKVDLLRLRMNFNIHLSDLDADDTIESEVVFTKSGLMPIWMRKKAVIAPRAGIIDDSYELEICYDNKYYSQNFHEKYSSPKAYYAQGSFQNGNISSIDVEPVTYYDNEELFFVIRAMNNLKTGASLTLYLANGYEIFNRNKFFTYLIDVVCGSSTVNLKMNDSITSKFSEENLATVDEEKFVPCIIANAYIDGKNRGAPIILYYAANPFDIPQTSNALMKIETSEYNTETRSLAYKTTYELVNYISR